MGPLRYTFVRVVLRRLREAPQHDPVPTALCVTVMLAGLNVMTAALLARRWWNWGRLFENGSDVRLALSFALVVGIGAVQYRLWVARDRLMPMLEAVLHEAAPQRRRRVCIAWTYALASVAALAAVVALLVGGQSRIG